MLRVSYLPVNFRRDCTLPSTTGKRYKKIVQFLTKLFVYAESRKNKSQSTAGNATDLFNIPICTAFLNLVNMKYYI